MDTPAAENRIALVTGANKGIGFEIARQLCARGFRVVLTARDARRGREAADALLAGGNRASFLVMDVADRSSILAAANEFARTSDRLDALVNNAGILVDRDDSILTVTAEKLERTLRTNVLGPILVAQAFWPFLKKAGGRIVNVSSDAGALNHMAGEFPGYGISKAALNAVTRKLAHTGREHGIVANSLAPGWVQTEMGGPGAELPVERGADTAVWLAAEAPPDLTGRFFRDRQEIPW